MHRLRIFLRFSRLRFAALLPVFCLGFGVGDVFSAQQPLNATALKDIRLYADFTTYLNSNSPAKQAELIRGMDLGMKMWQSILPQLNYQWVSDASLANVKLRFGSFINQPCSGVPSPLGWTACSFFPDANGNIPANAVIYFNENDPKYQGRPTFDFDLFTNVLRQEAYASYIPATRPPELYGSDDGTGHFVNPGFITGRMVSKVDQARAEKEDIAGIFFHEFGHSLGMQHFNVEGFAARWYGQPSKGTFRPAQPYQFASSSEFPLLPPEYVTSAGYYGGGTGASDRWVNDLHQLDPIVNNHMHGVGGKMPPGIPLPPEYKYNNRVVFAADLDAMPSYQWSFPEISGLIRLQNFSTGGVSLTSNWKTALSKADLDKTVQTGWVVTGVFPRLETHPHISPGAFHTLAIRDDGSVWAWGRNHRGQLGTGSTSTSPSTSPVKVSGLNSGFVSVAAGNDFSFALRNDGVLFAWGANPAGVLGENTQSDRYTPTQVCNVTGLACQANRYAAIAAGDGHAIAIKTDGSLWAWGYGGEGQLGNGSNANSMVPIRVGTSNDWIAVAAGSNHSVGLKADGSVWAWGYNNHGQLGNGSYNASTVPVQEINLLKTWTNISAGGYNTSAQYGNVALFSWGDNAYGQLGQDPTVWGDIPYPYGVRGQGQLSDWHGPVSGSYHSGALRNNGQIWTWGADWSGQLGDNATTNKSLPAQIAGGMTDFSWLGMRLSQSFAVRSNGLLYAWGYNEFGQLGNGSASGAPVFVPTLSKFANRPTLVFKCGFSSTDAGSAAPLTEDRVVLAGAKLSLYLSATITGNAAKVEFLDGSTVKATISTAPFKYTYANLGRGQYNLTARITDQMGTVVTSPKYTVNIHEVNIAALAATPATVNLTTEAGASGDWVQWGYKSSGDFISRKNLATPLIKANVSFFNTPVRRTNATSGFSWTDGKTPVSVTATKAYIASNQAEYWSNEFPVSTTAHTAKVYLRYAGTSNYLFFKLGNYIAPAILLTTSGSTSISRVYSVTFAGATSGIQGSIAINADYPPGDGVGIQAMVFK